MQKNTDDLTAKAKQQLQICNACRYCEGLCPVFEQITHYRTFENNTLHYLANLCHNCKACYYGCQYADPHEFDVNIPQIFTELRQRSFIEFSQPKFLNKLFTYNATVISIAISLMIAFIFILAIYLNDSSSLWRVELGPGSFFKVIPLPLMGGIPLIISAIAVLSIIFSIKHFIKFIALGLKSSQWQVVYQSLGNALTLSHANGGKDSPGCYPVNDKRSHLFKIFHLFTFYGFLLAFASTIVASFYHYVFGQIAPYDYTSLPVLLGSSGGVGLIIGTVGLIYIKTKADTKTTVQSARSMEYAFIYLLLFISLSGMALLFLRSSEWMITLLCLHLGFVFAFFLILPYSKFMHLIYRFCALLKYNASKNN